MAKITLTRTNVAPPQDMDAARELLFQTFDGFSEDDKKAWRRFWHHMMRLEPGDLVNLELVFPRNSKFHRKFFALLTVGFDAWEPGRKHKTHKGIPIAKNFERFRNDVTILAGFFEQTFDLRGRMVLEAKSISFAKMDNQQFEEVYGAVATVLLEKVLTNYKDRAQLDDVVDKIMGFL